MVVIYVVMVLVSIVISYMVIKEAIISALKSLLDDDNFVEKLKEILMNTNKT